MAAAPAWRPKASNRPDPLQPERAELEVCVVEREVCVREGLGDFVAGRGGLLYHLVEALEEDVPLVV